MDKRDEEGERAFVARLAELIGEPNVSQTAARAAINDPLYLHQLNAARAEPDLLRALLETPPKTVRSTPRALSNATKALARWALSGFQQVSSDMLTKRLSACAVCPRLGSASPSELAYLATKVIGGNIDGRVCDLCGCLVDVKARLASEACPEPHPENFSVSRWSEPIRT